MSVGNGSRGEIGHEDDPDDASTETIEAETALDRAIQSRIGEQLRAMYDGLMEQPVPDRFHALLAQLGDPGGPEG